MHRGTKTGRGVSEEVWGREKGSGREKKPLSGLVEADIYVYEKLILYCKGTRGES
jgi:hypothetical protein